jgi:nucleoside diphosphate kinase
VSSDKMNINKHSLQVVQQINYKIVATERCVFVSSFLSFFFFRKKESEFGDVLWSWMTQRTVQKISATGRRADETHRKAAGEAAIFSSSNSKH